MFRVLEPPPCLAYFARPGLLELPRLVFSVRDLARQPRGHGQPVLLLPGYGAGDGSTVILKSYLRLLGYRVRGWGLGRNSGDVPDLLPRVLKRISSFSRKTQQEVRLIGWSLGGYLAREAARERPDLVHRVITLGTPVVGGPKYTVVARRFHRRGMDMAAIEAEIELRNQISLRTPVTAIYSRADAVVAWEACIDQNGSAWSTSRSARLISVLVFCGSLQDHRPAARRRRQPSCQSPADETGAASWLPTLAVNSNASPYPQLDGTGTSNGFSPYSLSPSV